MKNTAEDLGSIRSFQDIRRLRSVMDKLPKHNEKDIAASQTALCEQDTQGYPG